MSRFDKFFSNIINKESRLYRRLQDLDDLIYDRYFNDFKGKTTYVAEVLSESNETPAEGNGGNSTLFLPIRVRIDGIHTNQIPDPYKSIQGLPEKQAAANFRALILSHPVAFPDTEIYSDSSVSQPLNRGDRIEVFFAQDGPENYGRQRGLRYGKVVAPAIARTVPSAASFIDTFESGQMSSVGDYEGKALTINMREAIKFMERMKISPYFGGYSDAALAGVAANAAAESAFKHNAAGDPDSNNERERSIEYNGKKWCSFGYFQLNICPINAEGSLLAISKGWMSRDGKWQPSGKENFIKWIEDTNGINQLKYIAERLTQIAGLSITTDSAYEFGEQMTIKFENPIDAINKGKDRGQTAKKILEAFNKEKGGQ